MSVRAQQCVMSMDWRIKTTCNCVQSVVEKKNLHVISYSRVWPQRPPWLRSTERRCAVLQEKDDEQLPTDTRVSGLLEEQNLVVGSFMHLYECGLLEEKNLVIGSCDWQFHASVRGAIISKNWWAQINPLRTRSKTPPDGTRPTSNTSATNE